MKVLFAVNNDTVSESIIKKYQQMYKEIIVSKNVYYFNAIIKELQKDKTYDRVVISEDLEPFTNNNYDMVEKNQIENIEKVKECIDDVTILSYSSKKENYYDEEDFSEIGMAAVDFLKENIKN